MTGSWRENEVLRRCLSLPACKSSGWHVARLGHVGELEVAAAAPLTRCESSGRHVARLLGTRGNWRWQRRRLHHRCLLNNWRNVGTGNTNTYITITANKALPSDVQPGRERHDTPCTIRIPFHHTTSSFCLYISLQSPPSNPISPLPFSSPERVDNQS